MKKLVFYVAVLAILSAVFILEVVFRGLCRSLLP